MARPEDYPGGASQFYSDLHSGDDDRQKQAANHQWANDPPYPRRFQDEPTPPAQGSTVSGGSTRPGTSGGTSDKFINELFRWRTIPVLVVLYLIFRHTPLVHEAGAYPGTVGRTVWGLVLLAVLFIALAICSPTAAKGVLLFIIGLAVLGVALLVLGYVLVLILGHHH